MVIIIILCTEFVYFRERVNTKNRERFKFVFGTEADMHVESLTVDAVI